MDGKWMNTPLKKLCLIGMIDSLCESIKNSKNESLLWRTQKLNEASKQALESSKIKTTFNLRKRAKKKVDSAYGYQEEFDVYEMLSFLLVGINDITHYNKKNADFLLVEKRIIWVMKLFDPKLEQEKIHQKAYNKYKKWESEK